MLPRRSQPGISSDSDLRGRGMLRAVLASLVCLLLSLAPCLPGFGPRAEAAQTGEEDAAQAVPDVGEGFSSAERLATLRERAESGSVRIHVMNLYCSDAIILESDGRFGLVDAGEDWDYPDGSDPRYPFRDGITRGRGYDDRTIAYMESLGVTSDNLEFVLGTHAHSDHIGALDEVIRAFRPPRVYLMEYDDSYITDEKALWDNQYVYDRAIAAAEETGAVLVQQFDEDAPVVPVEADEPGEPTDPEQPTDPTDPEEPGDPEDSAEPRFAMLSTAEVAALFGADPADAAESPRGAGEASAGGIPVPASDDPNDTASPLDAARTGNPAFMLGSALIEVVNYSDDYKFAPKPDANYFSLGVKVSAGGRSAFLAGDINNYDGDETRLSAVLGSVDVLKLGHHGTPGSNTTDYLRALSPRIVVQTLGFDWAAPQLVADLRELGAKHYDSTDLLDKGYEACVVSLSRDGVSTNVPTAGYELRYRDDMPPCMFKDYEPVRFKGWFGDGETRYGFDGGYVALSDAWFSDGASRYYLDGLGRPLTGMATLEGKRYCFDDESGALRDEPGWLARSGRWHWVSADGSLARGWVLDGSTWYYLDPATCEMATTWAFTGGRWYAFEPWGGMVSDGWLSRDGSWYWAGESGALATGWLLADGTWYWMDPDSCAMRTGWYRVDGEWNWSDASGAWHANRWVREGGSWWYAWADGTYPTSSWQLIDGARYRFDADGWMQTGWAFVDGAWYRLSEGGAMQTGWRKVDGAWYYLGGDGAMRTGWQLVDGAWYYLDSSGAMAENRWVGDYYVGESGAMAANAWVGDYHVGPDGRWDATR